MIVRYGGTYVRIHESRFLRAFESKALYDNKTTDDIESDDSEDEDERNTDAAENGTKNNDDFPSDVHQDGEIKDEDFGVTANIEQGSSVSGRQVNPNVITVQKDQIVQFQLAENGKEHEAKILGQARKASTKTKNQYNIKYIKPDDIKGSSMFIDLSTVNNLKIKPMEIQTEELNTSTIHIWFFRSKRRWSEKMERIESLFKSRG